ncbi:hypothetical protein TrLO_g2308 [Triparma laevis f. longispina]|uniref:C2H2-type domain-containing protein n=1 Tax=Triparma laevis f. longispina TaxID=1714387 RepID=A0A9W7CHB2_9STRA|nr:hypothetical protein TrLO_g2308 [Triparma laevis f. longispina]
MSADAEGGEGIEHRRLGFDGNETPRLVDEETSSIASHGIANDDWEDDSVAGGAGGDGISVRRAWNRYKRIEVVELDKRGNIIRACGIAGCPYKAGNTGAMWRHKAAKHGTNVVWFSCDQDNCNYKSKEVGNLKSRKRHIHKKGVVWHQCNSCDYRAKQARVLKRHKQHVHDICTVWHHCDSCDYTAKHASNLKKHKNRKQ